MRVLLIVLRVLAAAGLGVLVGVVGAFTHAQNVLLFGQRWAYGVPLAILALLAAQYVTRRFVGPRSGPAAVMIGWLIAVVVLASERPEGDLVLPADGPALTYLFVGLIAAGIMIGIGGATAKAPARR